MCGRTILTLPDEELADLFALIEFPKREARYNVAPSQPTAIIREPGKLELLRWGLILPNAKGANGINVRVESVARVPAYRDSFRQRRCLVIVDGFYEWKHTGEKKRQPYLVRRTDRKAFALAGIWDQSITKDGEVLETCAVITGAAKEPVASLHDRMPLIVAPSDLGRWLDVDGDVSTLLNTNGTGLEAYPVSTMVNSPAVDDPRCLEREEPIQASLF